MRPVSGRGRRDAGRRVVRGVERFGGAGGEFAERQLQVDQLLVAGAQEALQFAAADVGVERRFRRASAAAIMTAAGIGFAVRG